MNSINKVYLDIFVPKRLEISMCVGSCVWACVEVGSCKYKTNAGFAWIFICVPSHSNTANSCSLSLNIVSVYAHGFWKAMTCILQVARGQSLLSDACLLFFTEFSRLQFHTYQPHEQSSFWEASHILLVSLFYPAAETAPQSQISVVWKPCPEVRSPHMVVMGYISCFNL